jgi:hypothetical protein
MGVRLDPELKEMAEQEAAHLGMPTAEFVRQAIVAWVARHEALRNHGKKTAPLDIERYLKALGRDT